MMEFYVRFLSKRLFSLGEMELKAVGRRKVGYVQKSVL